MSLNTFITFWFFFANNQIRNHDLLGGSQSERQCHLHHGAWRWPLWEANSNNLFTLSVQRFKDAVGRPGRWLPFKLLTQLWHSWTVMTTYTADWWPTHANLLYDTAGQVKYRMPTWCLPPDEINLVWAKRERSMNHLGASAGFIMSQRDTHLTDPTTQSSFYGSIFKHTPTWRKNWNIYYGP